MDNGYKNERMILADVCEWLVSKGYKDHAVVIDVAFVDHRWTVDGMLRTDVIKDCFKLMDPSGLLFRQLECDVITYMGFIPDYEAHVN